MNDGLERTHLFEWHREHGAVVPFAGWEMPVRYTDIREEHMAIRDSVGILDVTPIHVQHFLYLQIQVAIRDASNNNHIQNILVTH